MSSSKNLPTFSVVNDITAIRIDQSINRLRSKSIYLGDTDIRKKLMWYKYGHGNIVIDKSTMPSKDSSPTKQTTHSSWIPSPVTLSTITHLTWDGFWLSSDGKWSGPTDYCKKLADIKISCTGGSPEQENLKQHFKTTLETVDALIARAHTANFCKQTPRLTSPIDLSPRIKFRHTLFSVRITRNLT
jgi:hypothetical protein